jgi:hypothetical protein
MRNLTRVMVERLAWPSIGEKHMTTLPPNDLACVEHEWIDRDFVDRQVQAALARLDASIAQEEPAELRKYMQRHRPRMAARVEVLVRLHYLAEEVMHTRRNGTREV